jgi:tripartite-type tricarboxylate transporter receptor subunit TctC
MQRRQFLLTAGALAASSIPLAALARDPANTRLLVGATPGGGTDILGRALGQELSSRMGWQFIVENKPGAAGNLAAVNTARAAPDGGTLLLAYTSHAINASLYPDLPFNPVADFTPICGVARSPSILVASPACGIRTLQDLIEQAKAKPGRLHIGIGGLGSSSHLAGEVLKMQAGLDIVGVPYKGATAALVDVMAGQVELAFVAVAAAQQQVRAGALVALGVTSADRLPEFPGVPAIGELLSGYESSAWFGLFGPAGMDKALVTRLAAATSAAQGSPAMRKLFASDHMTPLALGPDAFPGFVVQEIEKWGKVVKATGLSAEKVQG